MVELSDREIYLIGRIIVLWGSLEYEIFAQTAETYTADGKLPKGMNNAQPSKVLELWKERVVDRASGRRKTKLEQQLKKIEHYSPYRHAIVHGMWDWSQQSPERISVTRVHKANAITTHFTADDLEAMALELSEINFAVRYPNGLTDVARERTRTGGFMSRAFVASTTGHPVADELRPPPPSKNATGSTGDLVP